MGKNDKDLLTLQREEESSLKKKDLMDKFVKIVDFLWETKSISKELTPEGKLKEVRKALLNSTFQFSSMYRSWIPKPNKPGPKGKMRRYELEVSISLKHIGAATPY